MVTERMSAARIAVPEPDYLKRQRIEKEARVRQDAFSHPEAKKYWSYGPKQLAEYWQNFFTSRIKVEPGMNIDVPIVSRYPFPEEILLELNDRRALHLFIPSKRIEVEKGYIKEENIPVADLDQIFVKAKVKEATQGNRVVDSGPFGWTVVSSLIDPPYRNRSRLEMQELRTRSNIGRLGFAGYLILADLAEELTGHRIDSAEDNSSRLFPVSIGGFQSPMVRFDNGRLKIISSGLADTHKQDSSGWR